MAKLHIDIGHDPSIFGPIAKYPTDDIRMLFTEIGCIMEDTSLLALIWTVDDENDVAARFRQISDATR